MVEVLNISEYHIHTGAVPVLDINKGMKYIAPTNVLEPNKVYRILPIHYLEPTIMELTNSGMIQVLTSPEQEENIESYFLHRTLMETIITPIPIWGVAINKGPVIRIHLRAKDYKHYPKLLGQNIVYISIPEGHVIKKSDALRVDMDPMHRFIVIWCLGKGLYGEFPITENTTNKDLDRYIYRIDVKTNKKDLPPGIDPDLEYLYVAPTKTGELVRLTEKEGGMI